MTIFFLNIKITLCSTEYTSQTHYNCLHSTHKKIINESNCTSDNTAIMSPTGCIDNLTEYVLRLTGNTDISLSTMDRGGTVVKVLLYKSEGCWFDSRWCHWNFSLT